MPMRAIAKADEGGWETWTLVTGFTRPRGLEIDANGNLQSAGDQRTGSFDSVVYSLFDVSWG